MPLTASEAKASVTLTADPAAGVSVSLDDAVKTEELKASEDHPQNFEFAARIVCKEIGTWLVNWTAQIRSAQNSDSGNDTLTGTTQVSAAIPAIDEGITIKPLLSPGGGNPLRLFFVV